MPPKQVINKEYFLKRTLINKLTDCWEWNRFLNKAGYGRLTNNRKVMLAHRLSYEYFIGKIPVALELDHLCRNKKCVNPKHLELVSHKENIIRGYAVKTHCKRGHILLGENLKYRKRRNGAKHRQCKLCAIASSMKGHFKYRKNIEVNLDDCVKYYETIHL